MKPLLNWLINGAVKAEHVLISNRQHTKKRQTLSSTFRVWRREARCCGRECISQLFISKTFPHLVLGREVFVIFTHQQRNDSISSQAKSKSWINKTNTKHTCWEREAHRSWNVKPLFDWMEARENIFLINCWCNERLRSVLGNSVLGMRSKFFHLLPVASIEKLSFKVVSSPSFLLHPHSSQMQAEPAKFLHEAIFAEGIFINK